MINKKISSEIAIGIILILAIIIGGSVWLQEKNQELVNQAAVPVVQKSTIQPAEQLQTRLEQPKQSSLNSTCAKEGETIGASSMPGSCCSGLTPLGRLPDGYDGDCTKPQPPTGLSVCGKCGDGICNNNFEGKCNCPEDCANSVCGKEGETLGGKIDRCCSGLKPKSLSSEGNFGGLSECAK